MLGLAQLGMGRYKCILSPLFLIVVVFGCCCFQESQHSARLQGLYDTARQEKVVAAMQLQVRLSISAAARHFLIVVSD